MVATCLSASAAQATPRTTLADGATGTIAFTSHTPASQRPLLARTYLAEPAVTITGVLTLPARPTLAHGGRSPAVILAHGTGGVSDEREHAWARRLNEWGIAAFVVDSYEGRGLRPPIRADTPGATHFAAHLVDVHRALALLATHPAIDGARIALMGFSRGSEVAVNAAFERFRVGALGDASQPVRRLSPVLSLLQLPPRRRALVAAPMPMQLGSLDEMTEPVPCGRVVR